MSSTACDLGGLLAYRQGMTVCLFHKRFNMSQAGFIERWCLNNVLAEVSSGADGSAVVRVHVPPLNAVTVPVAT
jgi:hypothetical protein